MPPYGPKFSQFHAVFRKIWQNHMLAPPPMGNPGSAPGSHEICVTVVSVGDALGRGVTGDLMSSCFAGHSRCKCDPILIITGAGSTRWCPWAAVLALLVL